MYNISMANILAISGPSGAGKGTIINILSKYAFPKNARLMVSCTTRKPREGEINGKHYHFVSKE